LVMDSSRSAGVQEVRGERESRRIFSSSSKLLLLLRLWQATNHENSARIEDVQICAVICWEAWRIVTSVISCFFLRYN
jgi:hypothetical protein